MWLRLFSCLVCLLLFGQQPGHAGKLDKEAPSTAAADLRTRIDASPKLHFHGIPFAARPPGPGWASGTISWVAVDHSGNIYEIQRGDKADPVLVLDREGKVLRSWGKGDFTIPHSIRIDPAGNVWTVDAGSSVVIQYSPLGKKLMTIAVGELAENGSAFRGTTDIAFGPDGHLFITDGYGNARVLEYTPGGKRVKQWGRAGTGPGEFRLPHAIQIDENRIVYVADRENGRIEKFDLNGNFLGEISHLGRVFSIDLAGDALWATIQPFNQPLTSGGWVVKLDRKTGKILGHLEVPQAGGHSVTVTPSGEPLTTVGDELLWFKAR